MAAGLTNVQLAENIPSAFQSSWFEIVTMCQWRLVYDGEQTQMYEREVPWGWHFDCWVLMNSSRNPHAVVSYKLSTGHRKSAGKLWFRPWYLWYDVGKCARLLSSSRRGGQSGINWWPLSSENIRFFWFWLMSLVLIFTWRNARAAVTQVCAQSPSDTACMRTHVFKHDMRVCLRHGQRCGLCVTANKVLNKLEALHPPCLKYDRNGRRAHRSRLATDPRKATGRSESMVENSTWDTITHMFSGSFPARISQHVCVDHDRDLQSLCSTKWSWEWQPCSWQQK